MAVAYTTYTAKAEILFHYHFVCEHCGRDSGMLASKVQGSNSINISGKGRPTPPQQAELQAGAQASAKTALRIKIQNAEKGKYGEGVSSKCPHCEKIQSWELKSGRWKPLWSALSGLGAGFFIMVFAGFFGKQAGNAAVIAMPLGFGAGLLLGLIGRVRAKADSARTSNRNKPEFIWPSVVDAHADAIGTI